MVWCSADTGAPERLLSAVREELGREDLSLIPMRKLDWPYTTTWERLARLLPDDPPSGVAPKPAGETGVPLAGGRYASPLDVIAASNQARARKDWKSYFQCLTPASCGAVFREILHQTLAGRMTDLARAIEKRLMLVFYDEETRIRNDEELGPLMVIPGRPAAEVDEEANAWVYEMLRKRVGDVPQFLTECMQYFPDVPGIDPSPLECFGVRIEKERASAYIVRTPMPISPADAQGLEAIAFLPSHYPVRFRRINGSWVIAHTFGDDY